MTVSTRIAVMDHGKIEQIGTPAEVYELPASRYVAEFLGDVNVFEGRVAERDGKTLMIESPEAGCRLAMESAVEAAKDSTAWVAFRPEKLSIAKEGPESKGDNVAAGEVWDIGYLGNMSIYHVKLDSGRKITVSQTNSDRTIQQPITWEDRVEVRWSPQAGVVLVR